MWWTVDVLTLFVTSCGLRIQDEEDTVDTLVKMLMEAESYCKEQTQEYDRLYDRWTSLCQVRMLWYGLC